MCSDCDPPEEVWNKLFHLYCHIAAQDTFHILKYSWIFWIVYTQPIYLYSFSYTYLSTCDKYDL